MFFAFLLSLYEHFAFAGRLILALPKGKLYLLPWRLLLFMMIWVIMGVLNAFHWLGFFIDECCFRGYRKVAIVKPLFILGIPRSGTTWLQRVLAEDHDMTTLTLWECLFAPSISQRYVLRRMTVFFACFARFASPLFRRFQGRMDAIHKIRLDEAEEDFLLLLNLQSCFLLFLLSPETEYYWKLAYFDQQISARKKRVVMKYYRRCLQKHLYFHGASKRILSKNPSFTPFLSTLCRTFPDACFVACTRPPLETVPSQLSSVLPALKALGYDLNTPLRDRMISMLKAYYGRLMCPPENCRVLNVSMLELTGDLVDAVQRVYFFCGFEISPAFATRLENLAEQGKRYKSAHRYDYASLGLNEAQLKASFKEFSSQ